MRRRMLELMGVMLVVTVVLLVSVAGPTSILSFVGVAEAASGEGAQAQAPATEAGQGAPPKTSWGEPDLQGIWTGEYQIPLQRPAKYAGREFFTDAEIAELDAQRAEQARFGDRVAPPGSEQDVAGAYSAVFTSTRRTGRRTSLIVDPPDGRIPSLTPEAQKTRAAIREFQLALLQATDTCRTKARGCTDGTYGPPSPRRAEPSPFYNTDRLNRADGPEDRSLDERCMQAILPDFGSIVDGFLLGGFLQIVQSPGAVSIFYDTGQGQGWQRAIPVTSSPHLPPHVRQWWGDSRGRWEGDTLVVDVTNFSPKTDFRGSRENLRLVERWTRTGPNALEHVVTIDDPTTWTKPWTVKEEKTKQSDRTNRIFKEPRCHEGNVGLIAILANMRAAEKAFVQKRGPDPATMDISLTGGSEETDDPLQ